MNRLLLLLSLTFIGLGGKLLAQDQQIIPDTVLIAGDTLLMIGDSLIIEEPKKGNFLEDRWKL